MQKLTTFSLLWIVAIYSCNQPKTSGIAIDYLGQATATDTAKLFAVGIVSSDSFEHSAPTFAPDGKTVLWSIVEMPSWKATILEVSYQAGSWTKPHPVTFSDTTTSDIYPTFSADGEYVFFSSGRKLPSGETPAKGNILWVVKKTKTGWGIPEPLDTTVSKGGDYSPSIARNGHLYFTHGPFRSPDWNIFMTENINNFRSAPKKLPPVINTPGYEDGPFVAPDESYVIFESDRSGGIGGSIDLYVSFKTTNGIWSAPINLGPTINSSAAERFARVSPDGRFLFFGSNRRQVNGKANFDIYWIDASVIGILRNQFARGDK